MSDKKRRESPVPEPDSRAEVMRKIASFAAAVHTSEHEEGEEFTFTLSYCVKCKIGEPGSFVSRRK
jgi:hypothetical protein